MLRAILIVAALAHPATAGRGTQLVKYLRDDSSYAAVIDVAHARRTPLVVKAIEAVRGKYPTWDKLATDGVAVEKLVDTVVLAGDLANDKHLVVVVEGRLDKIVAAMKPATAAKQHAGIAYWEQGNYELALVDRRLVITGAGEMANTIDRVRGKPKGSPKIREMLAAAPQGSDLFGGMVIEGYAGQQLGVGLGAQPEWMSFAVAAASKLVIDVRFKLADEDAAEAAVVKTTALVEPYRGQFEQTVGKDFADSLTIDRDRALLRVGAALTAEELEKVLAYAKLLL